MNGMKCGLAKVLLCLLWAGLVSGCARTDDGAVDEIYEWAMEYAPQPTLEEDGFGHLIELAQWVEMGAGDEMTDAWAVEYVERLAAVMDRGAFSGRSGSEKLGGAPGPMTTKLVGTGGEIENLQLAAIGKRGRAVIQHFQAQGDLARAESTCYMLFGLAERLGRNFNTRFETVCTLRIAFCSIAARELLAGAKVREDSAQIQEYSESVSLVEKYGKALLEERFGRELGD